MDPPTIAFLTLIKQVRETEEIAEVHQNPDTVEQSTQEPLLD